MEKRPKVGYKITREVVVKTDEELLKIILGNNLGRRASLALAQMKTPHGMVPGNFTEKERERIRAVAELSGRFLLGSKCTKIRRPKDIIPFVTDMKFLGHEELRVICVSIDGVVHSVVTVGIGKKNSVPYETDRLLRTVLLSGCHSFFLVHNHPDGPSTPSKKDLLGTRDTCAAALVTGLKMLDHIIISIDGICSIRRDYPEYYQG